MKKVLVPLAAGAEEMETVIIVDVLRRAGLEVVLAGLDGPDPVLCSRNVKLLPDCALADAAARGPFDAIVLPGGAKGAENLAASPKIQELLRTQAGDGRIVGAICAAPIALEAAGVGKGRALTSHPSVKEKLAAFGAYKEERVVRDGKLVTSRGPGTAFEFALALIEDLLGREAAEKVAGPMLLPK
ncbi:MAG: DJ-1/PfpI family protein [Planctomycetota bacterium]|nr:DJ-1/PfpI family protein [Planctomycetota bacterium]